MGPGLWSLAQVSGVFGAGVIFGVGPAPQKGLSRATVAQVRREKPHLRQQGLGPAPTGVGTCARNRGDLRQNGRNRNSQRIATFILGTSEAHLVALRAQIASQRNGIGLQWASGAL